MGYSVGVYIKDRKLRNEVMRFLGREYHPWCKLSKGETYIEKGVIQHYNEQNYLRGPTTDLSYISNKQHIGFDYHGGEPDRYYAHMILRLVARWVGRKTIRYDVNPKDQIPIKGIVACNLGADEYKRKRVFYNYMDFNEPYYVEAKKIIDRELKRLNIAWYRGVKVHGK
jgi:hypothetical protein